MSYEIRQGDALELLRAMPGASVDAVVTDPPYGLNFMGKEWDHGVPGMPFWTEALRVLKPGGHLVAFGGTRTYHRLACAIEDAGFEVRDCLMWLYGSGFPKSLDVSKAIDKAAGAEREVVGSKIGRPGVSKDGSNQARESWRRIEGREDRQAPTLEITAPATDAARQWQGWGTALKPAWESIIVARKGPGLTGSAAILAHRIARATCRLRSFARDAGLDSASSRSVFGGGSASALWAAVEGCSTPGALFDLMGTWPSGLAIPLSLNTVWSWLDTLAAISTHESTFTTEMRSSLTTDLKILNSSRCEITPATITGAAISGPGIGSSAGLAAGIFRGVSARLAYTLAPSALGPATSTDEGLALRPNFEPIILARKPLIGTVAANVQEHGVGAINIDGCRIACTDKAAFPAGVVSDTEAVFGGGDGMYGARARGDDANPTGRWPANLVLDEESALLLDEQSGESRDGVAGRRSGVSSIAAVGLGALAEPWGGYGSRGGASRFFYTAKASSGERHYAGKNAHPTVKPVDLMRWLCRLVTRKGGLILDPFMGSGSTGVAALSEGFRFLGMEIDPESVITARRRIAGPLFAEAP